MTSTEIALRETNGVAVHDRDTVDGWVSIASDVIKVANLIAETEFVPAEYRDSPPAVAAAILTGRELGIGPMMSLRHVQIVRGVPTLSAEYKRARVLAAGHEFEVLELTTQRCRVRGRRAGTAKWLETSFTMEDAKTAGLGKSSTGKPSAWQTRPRRMLFARAGSELCDFLFADVTNGLPTAELVASGSDDDEFAGYDEAPAQAPPAESNGHAERPAGRTAKRRTPASGGQPAPKPAPAASEAPEPSGPPLPGEEDEPPAKKGNGWTGVIQQHFKRLGFGDDKRDTRLKVTARLAGVSEITSTDDLTDDQKKAVADTLARCKNQEALGVLLAERNAEDGQETLDGSDG